jgi:hypothetical protein
MGAALKAYQVRESYEGHCVIRFADNNATARREGAQELDCDWTDIESCQRQPELDQYAPGPVPPLVLIEAGWWFECTWCGRRVEREMDEEDEDGLPLPGGPPVVIGQSVFCCAEHAARQLAHWRGNAAARAALCELVYTRWPQAQVLRAHVYGDRLDYQDPAQGGWLTSVEFTLPGLARAVAYHWGCPDVWVARSDEAAFRQLYSQPAAGAHPMEAA